LESTTANVQPCEPICRGRTTYECTKHDCSYLTNSEQDWRRHETGDKHWPQERYMCLECPLSMTDGNGHPMCTFCYISIFSGDLETHYLQCASARARGRTYNRKDRFCRHLRDENKIEITDQKIAICRYPISSNWPRQCGFCETYLRRMGSEDGTYSTPLPERLKIQRLERTV